MSAGTDWVDPRNQGEVKSDRVIERAEKMEERLRLHNTNLSLEAAAVMSGLLEEARWQRARAAAFANHST